MEQPFQTLELSVWLITGGIQASLLLWVSSVTFTIIAAIFIAVLLEYHISILQLLIFGNICWYVSKLLFFVAFIMILIKDINNLRNSGIMHLKYEYRGISSFILPYPRESQDWLFFWYFFMSELWYVGQYCDFESIKINEGMNTTAVLSPGKSSVFRKRGDR